VRKDRDIAFEMAASSVRYGAGVTRELGADLADRGHHRVMVVTDRVVAALAPVAAVLETLERHKIHVVLYDYVRVEPTDASLRDAIEVASRESCDAFVAVGGCFVAAASWLMRRQALVPLRDPRLAESLAFENV